jgi:TolB-like protein
MELDPGAEIWFGEVSFDPRNRELRGRSRAVRIDRRACDVLQVLIESRDRALPREEILDLVWPGAGVAPGSVTVQVHALREAFRLAGCRAEPIRTLRAPARYQFCLDVTKPPAAAPPPPAPPPAPAAPVITAPALGGLRPRGRVPAIGLAAVVLLGVLTVLGLAVRTRLTAAPARIISIAIEPFADLTPGASRPDLANVLTRRLTGDLAGVPGIGIAAGATAAALAGRPPQAIGRALHVRYVLEGSLTDEAGQMHVTYGLVESATGVQLDGSSFSLPDSRVEAAAQLILRRVTAKLQSAATQG